MPSNASEAIIRNPDGTGRSIGFLDISCRTATDWYVLLGKSRKSYIVADHLPDRVAAQAAARNYLAAPFDPEAGLTVVTE